MSRAVLAALLLASAGCLSSAEPEPSSNSQGEFVGTREPPSDALLVEREAGIGYQYDVLCTLGGGVELRRIEEARIEDGHATIEFRVHSPPTSTGTQLGYQLDGSDVEWLPVVFAEDATHRVEIPAGALETDVHRWAFWFQQDLKPAPQGCYTGASLFQETFTIVAVAG